MSLAQWSNIKECKCLVTLKDLHRRDLTCRRLSVSRTALVRAKRALDDLAKDACSGSHCGTRELRCRLVDGWVGPGGLEDDAG